jgi:hypothetical protein
VTAAGGVRGEGDKPPRLRNPLRKVRAERRIRNLMIDTRKERHGSVEVADPDLGCAGVEVEGSFFVDLGRGVGRRKDLDADFGCSGERDRVSVDLGPVMIEPGNVHGLDAVGSRDWTLGQSLALRHERLEKSDDMGLAPGVSEGRWRGHKNASKPISLNAIGELGQAGITEDFTPSGEVESGLRFKIGELNRDRHGGKIRQKWKKA